MLDCGSRDASSILVYYPFKIYISWAAKGADL